MDSESEVQLWGSDLLQLGQPPLSFLLSKMLVTICPWTMCDMTFFGSDTIMYKKTFGNDSTFAKIPHIIVIGCNSILMLLTWRQHHIPQVKSLISQERSPSPLQSPISSPCCYLCIWLTACKLEVPTTTSSGSVNLPDCLTNAGNKFTY